MSYIVTLTDDTATWSSPTPDTPLTVETIEHSAEVTTLDLNVYVDMISTKKVWTVQWGYMDDAQYRQLRGFYDRQFTAGRFPQISIETLGVEDITARMTLSDQNITDQSGLVENVELTLRETKQMGHSYLKHDTGFIKL